MRSVVLEPEPADHVVGLLITVAILVVLEDAAREVYRRLMEAVDPALVEQAEAALRAVAGVRDVTAVRLRIPRGAHRPADDLGLGFRVRLLRSAAVISTRRQPPWIT